MGCVDAKNGIFNTLLIMLCSHLQTKLIESKFTDEITEGWRVLRPTHHPLATPLGLVYTFKSLFD